MPRAVEILTGRVVNPGAVLTAVTPNAGDSFVVKNFEAPNRARIVGAWAESATAGILRIRSPRLHDPVQGLRFRVLANFVRNLLRYFGGQHLVAGDALIVEQSGGGAETDCVALLLHYDDMEGAAPNLADWGSVAPRIANLVTQEVAVVAAAVAGDWSPGLAINATFDNLKANTHYAILGYTTDVSCCAVAVRGPDTGNVRMGGPGTTEHMETRDWFRALSDTLGEPCIPVFHSNNKGTTLVFVTDSAAGTAINVNFVLAELTGAV